MTRRRGGFDGATAAESPGRAAAVSAMRAGGFADLGGGWIRLPSGLKVQGWDAAVAALGRSVERAHRLGPAPVPDAAAIPGAAAVAAEYDRREAERATPARALPGGLRAVGGVPLSEVLAAVDAADGWAWYEPVSMRI